VHLLVWIINCTKFTVRTPKTPFLNLCPLVFGLTPVGWLRCVMVPITLFIMEISFFMYALFIYAHFSGKYLRRRTRVGCIVLKFIYCFPSEYIPGKVRLNEPILHSGAKLWLQKIHMHPFNWTESYQVLKGDAQFLSSPALYLILICLAIEFCSRKPVKYYSC
jgi:hypothetical protein